jgi:hypothetical protein
LDYFQPVATADAGDLHGISVANATLKEKQDALQAVLDKVAALELQAEEAKELGGYRVGARD